MLRLLYRRRRVASSDDFAVPASITTLVGSNGLIFVPNPEYLYTDAGTTNVTASGQQVEEWHDATGRGVVLARAGTQGGITFQESGGVRWVKGDGTARLTGAWPTNLGPPFFVATSGRQTDATQDGFVRTLAWSDPNQSSNYFAVFLQADQLSGVFGIKDAQGNGDSGFSSITQGQDHVVGGRCTSDNAFGRVNGNEAGTGIGTDHLFSPNSGDNISTLGRARSGSADFVEGYVYAITITDDTITSQEETDLEEWCANRAGETLV